MNVCLQLTNTSMRSGIRMISTVRRSSSTTNIPPIIQRHGAGDGIITLNVGGKNFQTLRSTVAQNDVLMDHVVRAEANSEIATDNAIFIDRDPKHFGVILAYLRNKADGMYRHHPGVAGQLIKFGNKSKSNGGTKSSNNQCQTTKEAATKIISSTISTSLPKDSKTLTEIYFESIHYNIPELTDRICSQQSLTRVFEFFGSRNPIQMATGAAVAGKRILVLLGGIVTGMGGWVYTQATTAQAKTNQFLADKGCDECGNDEGQNTLTQTTKVDYWKKQSDYWKIVADKFQ